MIVAIIAGGSGTRLWPLSTPEFPKHLLSLHSDQTLLQETYKRSQRLSKDIYIITEKSHAHEVKKQLPKLNTRHIIIEPQRRGTASCIMLALHRIKQHHRPDEPVIFCHADAYITGVDDFILTAETAAKAASQTGKITLIGIKPHYPSVQLGYIKRGKRETDGYELPVYQVDQFEEKPSHATAEKYLASGNYLWNMGVFAAPLAVFEERVKKYNPALYKSYQSLGRAKQIGTAYAALKDQPIDTALIEKDPNVLVVPGTFGWADIGSFLDLYHVVEHDQLGNYVEGKAKLKGAGNNYVYNHDSKPLLILGLDNIVVVNTKDGLLISRRDRSPQVGPIIKEYWADNDQKK